MMGLFKISKEERWPALAAGLPVAGLNVLMVLKYHEKFTRGGHLGFWSLFYKNFHLSGFDSYNYMTLSSWNVYYDVTRHPLLSVFAWPAAWLNGWLMEQTGHNHAVYIVAVVMTLCALYSFLFLRRLLRTCVGLGAADATLLCFLFLSFAYVLLSTFSPDHFGLSMFLLLLTLLVAATRQRDHRPLPPWLTGLLYTLTAGVTLTNGVKTLLAAWQVNGRRFFSWRQLLVGVALPTLLMGGAALWQQKAYVEPKQQAGRMITAIKAQKDSTLLKRGEARQHMMDEKNGQPVADVPLLKWSNMSLERWPSVVENMFGESLQLHRDHLLEDIFYTRPVIVRYGSWFFYAVEALLAALFLAGAWCGRRERLVWLALSWLAFDLLLHVGFGFGLNEVYIMTAHWAFVIPVCTAYLLRQARGPLLAGLRLTLAGLTGWLLCYNGSLTLHYLLA